MANNFLQAAQQFVGNLVSRNMEANLMNTPWKNEAIRAIMSGDQEKGEQLARNILQSYGFSSPEEAVQKGLENLGQKR